MKLQKTFDYALFLANPFQRTFRQPRVDDLIEKMKAYGAYASQPISVYRDKNGKLVINTGHHRYAAAKALGLAIHYVIEHQWTLEEMVAEGISGSTWDLVSVVQTFARSGCRDYQDLLGYADKGLPLSMAASLLVGEGASSGNARERIAAGTFRIKTRKYADKIIDIFEKFSIRIPAVLHRPFVTAYSKCMMTPEFDEDVFLRRMTANPTMLEKTSNEDQMLKLIEEIYNFKSPKKIPLAFLVSENSKVRKATFGKGAA